MLKKGLIIFLFTLVILFGQFLHTQNLLTGSLPVMPQKSLQGATLNETLSKGGILYFWAEWCGVCKLMQPNITSLNKNSKVLTIAIRSGNEDVLRGYLSDHQLDWHVINDPDSELARLFGIHAVPAVFFVNTEGQIVFTAVGYTSEWGLRARYWLSQHFKQLSF
jgi:thiol-disulfide isomerase/thioredoxin